MNAPPSLRELFLADHGVDLPIGSGTGSKDNPIEITAADPIEAVRAQMETLRLLGKRRGIAWQLVGLDVLEAMPHRLIRACLETFQLTESETIRQHEAYYFQFDALPDSYSLIDLPPAKGFTDSQSGLQLPFQLSWLHLQGAIDNEVTNPGLGWTVAYSCPGIKATVFIYDLGSRLPTNDVDQERVLTEYQSAISEIQRAIIGAKLSSQTRLVDPKSHLRWIVGLFVLDDGTDSMLALTAANGFFVKVRITYQADDEALHGMGREALMTVLNAIHFGPFTAAPNGA